MKTEVKENKSNPVVPQKIWMKEEEAAAYLGISRRTLMRIRNEQLIQYGKLDNKTFAYTRDMLDEYVIENGKRHAQSN